MPTTTEVDEVWAQLKARARLLSARGRRVTHAEATQIVEEITREHLLEAPKDALDFLASEFLGFVEEAELRTKRA